MTDLKSIKAHMEVIGADGVHVGTVDAVEGDRIKLTKQDSGSSHHGHHHYVYIGLVAGLGGNEVRQATSGANAILFEEEAGRDAIADHGDSVATSSGENGTRSGQAQPRWASHRNRPRPHAGDHRRLRASPANR